MEGNDLQDYPEFFVDEEFHRRDPLSKSIQHLEAALQQRGQCLDELKAKSEPPPPPASPSSPPPSLDSLLNGMLLATS